MNELKDMLARLDTVNPDWRSYLELKIYDTSFWDDTKKLLMEIISRAKEKSLNLIDTPGASEPAEWLDTFYRTVGEPAQSRIKEAISGTLAVYRETRAMAQMEEALQIELMTDVFENMSVYYNPAVFHTAEKYGIDDYDTFRQLLVRLDGIISTHISRHLHPAAAADDFKNITRLTSPVIKEYETLYRENYQSIQYNLIIDRIDNIDRMVAELLP